LPVISLPNRGEQQVQPIHVFELAEAVTRQLEQPEALHGVYELGGAHAMSYREMLAAYRNALGLAEALWLPVPMPLMTLFAWAAEALPQKVFCRDTMRLLERGKVPTSNAAEALLGRAPTELQQGLSITPPQPWLDLSARLSPLLSWGLRGALAAMWIYTALISALLPHQSGVLQLLARCGFTGQAGVAALVFSCALNLSLGLFTLLKPTPWLYAVQTAAVLGYTLTAAWFMPELTLDHCGPLLKNLPVLMAVLVLWMARPASAGFTIQQIDDAQRQPRTARTSWA
jgi:DoxX-like family